jgi:hypothetical protein
MNTSATVINTFDVVSTSESYLVLRSVEITVCKYSDTGCMILKHTQGIIWRNQDARMMSDGLRPWN